MNLKRHIIEWFKRCFSACPLLIGFMWFFAKRHDIETMLKQRFPKFSYLNRLRLRLGMARAYSCCGLYFTEYVGFGLYDKDFSEWGSFVSDIERIKFAKKYNKEEDLFNDKVKTYERLRSFYKREVVVIENTDAFRAFASRHSVFFVKPRKGSLGQGAFVYKDGLTGINRLICDSGDGALIAEELLKGCDELAKLHPASLNTVRVPTFRTGDEIEVYGTFLRCGRGDACVDNAGAGGIICRLDEKTGVVSCASDEAGIAYEYHPDTNIKLVGFAVPHWDELLEVAKKASAQFPSNHYCSWDLALTDSGWALIEGNFQGQFVWQIATKKGFRKKFNEIIGKFNQECNA